CAITLSLGMNSSARRNGVPVAAQNGSKQESSSALRASRTRSRLGIFRSRDDNNTTDSLQSTIRIAGIVGASAVKLISFRVSQSGARAEILFAAPNCDARCLFAPRESGPARLQPWLRSLGCDRQRQSPPHLAVERYFGRPRRREAARRN